jgi:hypothetical protein
MIPEQNWWKIKRGDPAGRPYGHRLEAWATMKKWSPEKPCFSSKARVIPDLLQSGYPKIAFRSVSGVLMGMILKFFTSTSRTLGVMKAGSEGPSRMFLIPR